MLKLFQNLLELLSLIQKLLLLMDLILVIIFLFFKWDDAGKAAAENILPAGEKYKRAAGNIGRVFPEIDSGRKIIFNFAEKRFYQTGYRSRYF